MDKKQELSSAMLDLTYYPNNPFEQQHNSKITTIPLSNITSLGVALSTLPASMRTITQTISNNIGGVLYERVDMLGGELMEAKNHPGLYRGVLRNNGELNGGTLFRKHETVPTQITTTVPYDPTLLLVAATLASIEKKLDAIQETQAEMMEFLKLKQEAELKGNLNTLAGILSEYKLNWNNDKYKINKHILVQDIKRNAEQSIILYQDLVMRTLSKIKLLHNDGDATKIYSSVLNDLQDYRLALYMFAFAAYLEILLLGNFEKEYLKAVSQKIDDYAFQYREVYSTCYDYINTYSSSSIQAKITGSISAITKGTGEFIAKMPLVGKMQLDENLIAIGNRIDKRRSSKVLHQMYNFSNQRDSGVYIFSENIRTIDALYNEPMEFFFDSDNIYLALP